MLKTRSSSVSTIIKNANFGESQKSKEVVFSPRVAIKPEEKLEAFRLAQEEYMKKGYIHKSLGTFLSGDYDYFYDTVILNVYSDEELAGTVTLTSPRCMPCKALFSEYIDDLPNKAEVCRLAIRDKYKNNMDVLLMLFDLILVTSKNYFHYDYIYSEVNPKHVKFYEKFCGFKKLSDIEYCERVNNAPAILLCLDLNETHFPEKRYPLLYHTKGSNSLLKMMDQSLEQHNGFLGDQVRRLQTS